MSFHKDPLSYQEVLRAHLEDFVKDSEEDEDDSSSEPKLLESKTPTPAIPEPIEIVSKRIRPKVIYRNGRRLVLRRRPTKKAKQKLAQKEQQQASEQNSEHLESI